jgi:hypothetical protein
MLLSGRGRTRALSPSDGGEGGGGQAPWKGEGGKCQQNVARKIQGRWQGAGRSPTKEVVGPSAEALKDRNNATIHAKSSHSARELAERARLRPITR